MNSKAQPKTTTRRGEPRNLKSGLVAPTRPGNAKIYQGPMFKKPWEYDVTVVIPVLDTPDQLKICLQILNNQSLKPYILIIDTGSLPENFDKIEALRAENVEIHYVRSHGWRHPSEPVAVACQLGQELCRTEYIFQTHCDCFLMSRTLLEDWRDLAKLHKVVGYQISPREYEGWETELGHTALMMHVPTLRALGISWNMTRFYERNHPPVSDSIYIGLNNPDTESEMNFGLKTKGLYPLILGTEENRQRNKNEHFDHPRSFCCSMFYAQTYFKKIKKEMDIAMAEALLRVEQWKSEA